LEQGLSQSNAVQITKTHLFMIHFIATSRLLQTLILAETSTGEEMRVQWKSTSDIFRLQESQSLSHEEIKSRLK